MPELTKLDDETNDAVNDAMSEVAECLAAITTLEDLPGVVERPHCPRSAAELAAQDPPAWLAVLVNEQGWLNLDAEVSTEQFQRDPLAAAERLFVAMGVPDAQAGTCVKPGPLGPILTERGAEELVERLAAAERCAQRCRPWAASRDENRCREEWEQAWSEESGTESVQPIPSCEGRSWTTDSESNLSAR